LVGSVRALDGVTDINATSLARMAVGARKANKAKSKAVKERTGAR